VTKKKYIIYQEDDKSKKITVKCHSNILNKKTAMCLNGQEADALSACHVARCTA
jgi:hypothetical protein